MSPASTTTGDRAPRVAMVVNNGISNDARVIKTALSLRRAGAEVTVLGVATAGGQRQETTAGGVRYVRLPVFPARGLSWDYARFALRRRVSHLVRDPGRWSRTLPSLRRYHAAFAPELRRLAPDVVHAHDIHLLDTLWRTWPAGQRPLVIYDAHEYVAGLAVAGRRTQREVSSWAALERDRIAVADAVVTVSPEIAQRLAQEQRLTAPPTVVHNAPLLLPDVTVGRSLRDELGLPRATPLAVYGGALSAARGLHTVIEALALVPRLHLAVITVPFPHPMAAELRALAQRCGVAERVHLVAPVAAHEVADFLTTADIGVSPIIGAAASYDMAMPNKLFEFLHAGLRIVTSDVRSMSSFVLEHGLGRVFRQGDAEGCAAALRAECAELGTPRSEAERSARAALVEEYTWQGQEDPLIEVYRSVRQRRPVLGNLMVSAQPWNLDDLTVTF